MELLIKLATQIPNLAALCFIVFAYIKSNERVITAIRDMHQEHLDAREQTRTVLTHNAEASEHQTRALDNLANTIERLKTRNT